MKIAVWKTGHEIADTVAEALKEGFNADCFDTRFDKDNNLSAHRVHLAYGILRGCENVFRRCEREKLHWFNADRGYSSPSHYDGYYRISYRGTQARWHEGIPRKPWDGQLEPWRTGGDYVLICPPTEPVIDFFSLKRLNGLIATEWELNATNEALKYGKVLVRTKSATSSIDWHNCRAVITFNSSIGWQALQRGIPVLSDPDHSIIGSYYNCRDLQSLTDKLQNLPDNRRELFEAMNAHQFTLQEIREGKAWSLIKHYITSSSDTMTGKQSAPMFATTP